MKKIIVLISILTSMNTIVQASDNKQATLAAPPLRNDQLNAAVQTSFQSNTSPSNGNAENQLSNLLVYGLAGFYIFPHIYKKSFDATGAKHNNELLDELLPRITATVACVATKFLISQEYDNAKTTAAIAVAVWITHVIANLKNNQ